MFIQRLLSGIVLLAVLITVIILGGNYLFAFVGIISLIGQYELYKAVKMEKSLPAYLGYVVSLIYEYLIFAGRNDMIVSVSIVYFLLIMTVYVFCYPKYVVEQISVVFMGFFYVTVLLSYIYQVRMGENGKYTIWLIIISAWGSDTCAYCVGRLIGKHKLPSPLSPKKTIEGCVGGVIGAGLLGMAYGFFLGLENAPLFFAVVCAVGSVIAQVGDLAASAIKRNHDIKDYGKLIPGHGGILDRFDSIIFTAPVVWLLSEFLQGGGLQNIK